jgi:nitronate monooxygenase
VLGVDLVYLATRYVATHESAADDDYRRALIDSSLDDVRLSTRVGGIPASLLACWPAGLIAPTPYRMHPTGSPRID